MLGNEMRVIAGKFRSRPLAAPAGVETRPTTDRLRETLFNVLCHGSSRQGVANRVEGGAFLDLYAGSGAVGIEALSRGAACVTLVENGTAAMGILRKNLDSLGIRTGYSVEKRNVGAFLRREARSYDVVFLDPPWDLAAEYETALGLLGGECSGLLTAGAVVVAEHRRKSQLEASYGNLARFRVLEQGDAGLSFYSIEGAPDAKYE